MDSNHGPVPDIQPDSWRLRVDGLVERPVELSLASEPSPNFFNSATGCCRPRPTRPALGSFAVNAAILTPDDGATVRAGPVTVAGYALAGDDRRVARVDISADGGRSWRQASLGEEFSPWSWRRWHATLDLPAGQAGIAVRAWDNGANVQPENEADLWNPKGYINNARARLRLTVEP